jgi:hypothetical protein
MKKLLAITLVSAISGSAVAADLPSIKLLLRGDLVVSDTKGEDDKSTKMSLPYMRLDIKGKVKEDLSYRVKFRLNKELDKTYDDSGKGVDYAYITHKLDDDLSIKLGKQFINIGGFESIFSSMDTYSQGSFAWNDASFYRTAVGAFYNIDGHSINVQIANNDEKDSSKDMMYGAQAILSFSDGMVKPLLSYHADTAHSDISAGLQLNFAAITIELDHLIREHNKVGGVSADDVSSTLFIKYKAGKWAPQIRYTLAENDKFERFNSYHAAIEYSPYNDGSFRYHLSYATTDNQVATGGDITKNDDSATVITGFALAF